MTLLAAHRWAAGRANATPKYSIPKARLTIAVSTRFGKAVTKR
jgi:hypothetical protein